MKELTLYIDRAGDFWKEMNQVIIQPMNLINGIL